MALTTILEEQICAGFADITGGAGLYVYAIGGALIEGETYQIKWDGVEYVRTAFSVEGVGTGVGNAAILGYGDDTGEPFCIGDDGAGLVIATLDSAESHTVGIYQVVASDEPEEEPEEEPTGNVLAKLFQDQANAIREGLGNIGKFAPATFAAKIREINKLIGTGGSGSGEGGSVEGGVATTSNLQFASGTHRTPEVVTGPQTVKHGLETPPDLIIVCYGKAAFQADEETALHMRLMCMWGMRSDFDAEIHGGVIYAGANLNESTGGFDNRGAAGVSLVGDDYFIFGRADNANGYAGLAPDTDYKWIAISGMGGVSSADVRYVTFKSEDGSEELCVKPVAKGDDCADTADLVARGFMEMPTKESTAEFNYVLAGWATTPSGALDLDCVKNVTTNRTVYANFAAVTRYYTVRFFDGDTLLTTMQVPYGGTADYTADKDGAILEGWEPSNINITADTDCYAMWRTSYNLSELTWSQIAAFSEAGQAADILTLGDTKTFTAGSTTYTAQIVGFDHDTLAADSTKKAGISFLITGVYPTKSYFGNKSGPWETSTVRTTCSATIYNSLPDDLRTAIKSVTKKSCTKSLTSTKSTTDTVWIPSAGEVGDTAFADGPKYELFDGINSATNGYHYWLRSSSSSTSMYYVLEGGGLNYNSGTSYKFYTRFGFCI